MDANKIVEMLLERIKLLTKENVILQARLEQAEDNLRRSLEQTRSESNVE